MWVVGIIVAVGLAALPYAYRETFRGVFLLQGYNLAVNLLVGLMLLPGKMALASFVGLGVGYSILSIRDSTQERQYGWTIVLPMAAWAFLGMYLLLFLAFVIQGIRHR